ncbi:MAG: hypothetical protein HQL52_07945 [Magnetococcales bacterium]|nr:hypothetical protein [Magnetococcales bacterium]
MFIKIKGKLHYLWRAVDHRTPRHPKAGRADFGRKAWLAVFESRSIFRQQKAV